MNLIQVAMDAVFRRGVKVNRRNGESRNARENLPPGRG